MSTEELDGVAEAQALKELLESQGWTTFRDLVMQEWNAERVLAKQAEALSHIPRGEQDAINDTVQQIQSTRREILALLELPKQRLAQLTLKPSRRPFAGLRRA